VIHDTSDDCSSSGSDQVSIMNYITETDSPWKPERVIVDVRILKKT
jgi:hypothetical protein